MSEFKTRLHSVPSGGFLTDRDKDKKPILDVRELGIDFGGLTAVDNFNLMIGRNEIAGLIGPNGAGKTTVFNLITGVYKPTEGSLYLNGERMNGKKTHQIVHAGIARTFQNIRLFKKMTGKTITGYLEEYRVNQSLPLVQSSQYSMIQIADMTGFSNASRFARAFRRQFGCNPGEYNSLKLQKC